MHLLKQLKIDKIQDESKINFREAVRFIWIDENNLIPLLLVSNHNYHKLPGGWIDDGEDHMNALKRECMEEIGAEIEMLGEIGEIHEYRADFFMKQVSYCYFGKITSQGKPKFTELELSWGFQIVWMTLDEAIEQIKNDTPNNYEGIFIQERDLCFLETYKQIVHS